MAMHDADAQKQIQQMVNFITNEANDKAQEIEARALEDFNIEKLRLVQQMKNKVRLEYQRKAKQMETQRAIARSTAINKSRLRTISARNVVVEEVKHGAAHQLSKLMDSPSKYQKLCAELMVQGCLRLLEDDVLIRCRKEDEKAMRDCVRQAEADYTTIIKHQTGVQKTVRLFIDKENYLPAAPTSKHDSATTCIGGVMLTTVDRKIVVNNTLDARLDLVVKQCMPAIRQTLFPVQ